MKPVRRFSKWYMYSCSYRLIWSFFTSEEIAMCLHEVLQDYPTVNYHIVNFSVSNFKSLFCRRAVLNQSPSYQNYQSEHTHHH